MNFFKHLYGFFASIHLAISTLVALAATSIIGTIIPQNESAAFYIRKFGTKTALFLQVLDIPEMYTSWWFLALLALLAVNLIVCSIERFPTAWKIIHQNNLSVSAGKIEAMEYQRHWSVDPTARAGLNFSDLIQQHGWSACHQTSEKTTLYFAQKGKWSRTGVYLVHLSILIIMGGAIIGQLFGFKGSVMIPELQSTATVYRTKTGEPFDLGYTIKCNSFVIDFYPNGMPKEYASQLTIEENGKHVLSRTIEVNKPLTYKGITFYQASYEGYQDFIISVTDNDTKLNHLFPVQYQKQRSWPEGHLDFGILNAEGFGSNVQRMKIWIKASETPPIVKWINSGETFTIPSQGKQYQVSAKQMYATGLQVAKDPGVWVVYFGCALMLIGLYMAFFMSHQRIWLLCQPERGERDNTTIILAGTANKNKSGFVKIFETFATIIQKNISK